MDSNSFWNWFGRFDNVIGVATAVISLGTLLLVWRQERRLRAQAKEKASLGNFAELRSQHEGIQSEAPVAFALSLIPHGESIRGAVGIFLRAQGWQMPIEELNLDGLNNAEDLERFVKELDVRRRYFELEGYTEIHLFIAGPVQAGTIIGSRFRNWLPVKLYHKPNPAPPQIYEYWMPLL